MINLVKNLNYFTYKVSGVSLSEDDWFDMWVWPWDSGLLQIRILNSKSQLKLHARFCSSWVIFSRVVSGFGESCSRLQLECWSIPTMLSNGNSTLKSTLEKQQLQSDLQLNSQHYLIWLSVNNIMTNVIFFHI